MPYDFDSRIERRGTASEKWDGLAKHYGRADLLPMWVADMDFAAPGAIVEALATRARHLVFGYTDYDEALYQAVADWLETRHGWVVPREWIVFGPGVIMNLIYALGAFTDLGDGVIIQRPVYHPFTQVVERNGRAVVDNPLVLDGGRYRMDLDDLRAKARSGARMLILCSPHNPVGRVWTREELTGLGDICNEHGILVVSDEVHGDLTYPGVQHVPYGSIGEAYARNSIVLAAPTKTFNLAGLQSAYAIVADPDLRRRLADHMDAVALVPKSFGNAFALEALKAAYGRCADWLDELRAYLAGNLAFLEDFLAREIPEIRPIHPEGTYLVWLDCRGLGMDADELSTFMRDEARVALNDGQVFGAEGAGFERINIACPRSMLAEALERMAAAAATRRR